MESLILSKTHMKEGKCCVGAITANGRYVRLLASNGENQDENTTLAPRQIWDITFVERHNPEPPHVEDVLVQSQKFKENLHDNIKVIDFIEKRKIPIWRGHPDALFDKMIRWTDGGSGYINKIAIPSHSVGFWVSDRALTHSISSFGKVRYNYKSGEGWKSLPYKGFDEPVKVIPAGILIRVSLARWWDTDGTTEFRCSLQLSGWYDYQG
jgi:hypothetical protein